MKKKIGLLIGIIVFLIVVIAILALLVVIKNRNEEDNNKSEELKNAELTFDIELNKDKTEYIIYDLKKSANTDDKTLVIPDTVDNIPVTKIIDRGNLSFSKYNNIKSITIGKNVNYIGNNKDFVANNPNYPYGSDIFTGATSLVYINVPEGNATFSSIEGVLYNKDQSVLIKYPVSKTNTSGSYSSFTMPDSVSRIYSKAFYQNKLIATITLSKNLKVIDEYAFSGCIELRQLKNFKEGIVEKISDYAFEGCKGLSEIELPTSLKILSRGAFYKCENLAQVYFYSVPETIGKNVFAACKKEKYDYDTDTVIEEAIKLYVSEDLLEALKNKFIAINDSEVAEKITVKK